MLLLRAAHFPCVPCHSNQHLKRSGLKEHGAGHCSDGAQCLVLDLLTVGEESVLWNGKSFQYCLKQLYSTFVFFFFCMIL